MSKPTRKSRPGLRLLGATVVLALAAQQPSPAWADDSTWIIRKSWPELLPESLQLLVPVVRKAAVLTGIPEDILAVTIYMESKWRRVGCIRDGARISCSPAMTSRKFWTGLATRCEAVQEAGIADFYAEEQPSFSNQALAIFAAACFIQKSRGWMQSKLTALGMLRPALDAYMKTASSFVVGFAIYNGGASILESIDNARAASPSRRNRLTLHPAPETVGPIKVVDWLASGRGYHARWARYNVRNYVLRAAGLLGLSTGGRKRCKVNRKTNTVRCPP